MNLLDSSSRIFNKAGIRANNGADCQGDTFLYSLALDDQPGDIGYVVFANPKTGSSHVVLSSSTDGSVWETTKPGYIRLSDIKQWGYTKIKYLPFSVRYDVPESLSVSHLHAKRDYCKLYQFIDSISVFGNKYPSPSFFLKYKLKALNKLFKNGLIEKEQYADEAKELIERLQAYDLENISLALELVKHLLIYKPDHSLTRSIEILEAYQLTPESSSVSDAFKQEFFFILAQCYLEQFLKTSNEVSKKQAINNFRKSLQLGSNQRLKLSAKNTIALINY